MQRRVFGAITELPGKKKNNMEEARLKENLPQEGTGGAGESLPELSSGCPSNSGGGKGLLPKETLPKKPTKTFTQQLFHPGIFNRQRSASLSDVPVRNHKKDNGDLDQIEIEQAPYNPSAPWQRVPNQKRNRSPNETDTGANQAKRAQRREQVTNKHRGIKVPEIEVSNSFSLLDVEERNAPAKRIPRPPPIILHGVDDLAKLTQLIENVVEKDDYTFKVVSKNKLIISSNNVDKYQTLIEHIRDKGLIGHTFTRKDQKSMRIVIKHLHFSTPKEAIIEAIQTTGNNVQGEIVTARKQGTKEPLNTFFVNIAPHENNKRVKEIKVIYNQRVIVEDPLRKTTVVQCKRCQQYGHSKNNCMRPYRCVKCAGAHNTTMCTTDANTPAVCTLCSGSHPASYKGCQVYQEIQARKHTGNKSQLNQKMRATSRVPNIGTTITNDLPANTNAITKPINNVVKSLKPTEPKKRDLNATESLELYSGVVKKWKKNTPTNKVDNLVDLTESHRQTYKIANADHTESQRTHITNHTDYESQRTHSRTTEYEKNPQEHRISLEALIIKQTERIDQLISQLNTMMNLIMTLISKPSQ